MAALNNNAAYRRGIVLGLTMAEIIILVVFLLLLAFAALLDREKKANQAQKEMGPQLEKISYLLSSQEPDMKEEIVRIIEKLPSIVRLINEHDLKEASTEAADEVITRSLVRLEAARATEDYLADLPREERLAQAVETQKELEAEVGNLKDQKASLIAQMEKGGRGVDWPPCWSTRDNKPEYIYKTDLTSDGIIIRDNPLPHRAEQKARIPIQNVQTDKLLSISQFQAQTRDLFEWSKKKECRFYVIVNDLTGVDEKQKYKQLLRTVEYRFYKTENISIAKRLANKKDSPEKIEESKKDGTFFSRVFGSSNNEAKPIERRGNFNQ